MIWRTLPLAFVLVMWGAEAAMMNYTSPDGTQMLFRCKGDFQVDHTAGDGLAYFSETLGWETFETGESALHCAGSCFEHGVANPGAPCQSFTMETTNCHLFHTTWTEEADWTAATGSKYCYGTLQ